MFILKAGKVRLSARRFYNTLLEGLFLEQVHTTDIVFGIQRELPLNYVSRKNVDELFVENLTRQKHIVIYGSSKQGKTSLRRHCLKEDDYINVHCSNKWDLAALHTAILKSVGFEVTIQNTKAVSGALKITAEAKGNLFGFASAKAGTEAEGGKETTTTTEPLELDPTDVNDVIKALGDFKKYIVLEDFHYLPLETQKDFAVALKAFHEQSKLCFIIVGVWLEENRLTVYNGDLTGRVIGINADKWSRDELTEVIKAGEYLLNVSFDGAFKSGLLDSCFDSVYIVQEACYQVCKQSGIHQTQKTNAPVGAGVTAKDIIWGVVNQQTGRYNSFISQFSSGFQSTELEMYKWLLLPILTTKSNALEGGLRLRDISETLKKVHPKGQELNAGNITQALLNTASLQVQKGVKPIVLDYDQTNLRLNVVDRGFLIWRDSQDQAALLELAGLPK